MNTTTRATRSVRDIAKESKTKARFHEYFNSATRIFEKFYAFEIFISPRGFIGIGMARSGLRKSSRGILNGHRPSKVLPFQSKQSCGAKGYEYTGQSDLDGVKI